MTTTLVNTVTALFPPSLIRIRTQQHSCINVQQVVGDRCVHGNVYFLQNLSENSADRIVPHILKTAPG